MSDQTISSEQVGFCKVGQAYVGHDEACFEQYTATTCGVVVSGFRDFAICDIAGAEGIEKREFDSLADVWESETMHLSSVSAMRQHPAYQAIKHMGDWAIPWVLERMDPEGAPWFHLLDELAPTPPEIERGNVRKIILAWKKWGRDHGYRT